MRRTATEILRRGFESVLANWPLLLIRIGESVLLVMIAIVAAVALIVPVLMSIGIDRMQSYPAGHMMEVFLDIIMNHLAIIFYVLIAITLMLVVFVAIHSFVVAGCVRVYVDAERKNVQVATPTRNDFRMFSGERWLSGGTKKWWSLFWIYNIAWGIGGLIMLLPLMAVAGVVFFLRENGPAAAVTGCVGLIFSFLFMFLAAIVTNVWTQKAIVDCVARNSGAVASLRSAWNEIVSDAGRHIAVAVVMIAVTIGGSMLFSTFSAMGSFDHSGGLMMMPLQFSASIANGIFSAAVGAWFLASFSALAVESPS
ncbi:MAG TPA: hypothetical protein VGK31_14605 [Thermoanaerobaculia bacterium]